VSLAYFFAVVKIPKDRLENDPDRYRQTRDLADALQFELGQRVQNAFRTVTCGESLPSVK
jgi:hypothetical protein